MDKEITKRAEDYSQWYLDVIEAAELADYAPVKGCMVIKPYGYAIWENIQKALDEKFKKTGVQNAYFPLFIPENFLKREAEHVEGFAPELAVVTHAGGKELEEPLVVRPTSETIIYDMFSKWIHSYRDLPLLINQWANVVRWEKRTRLFLRTTEFLWQEGHTAHATKEEADAKTMEMLKVYQDFAENHLAMPVIPGQKSDSEKFAGAEYTTTIEAMMQDKKALQSGTSHMLGQNFAKPFEVKFLDKDEKTEYAWQTSWGVSTRIIGGLIMTHSDDKGLVLPPKIAPIQVVIVPVWVSEEEEKATFAKAEEIAEKLRQQNVDVKIDKREGRPGPKFFEWEKKGVPMRLEIGPKDIAKQSIVAVRRDSGEKKFIAEGEIVSFVVDELEDIQRNLFDKALEFRKNNTHLVNSWEEFKEIINGEGGFLMAHWCGDVTCEEKIKEETKASTRCIPFDQPEEEGTCVYCGKKSNKRIIFARAY
ncbi:MAG TPA: proline--tRNA ligase [Patescibacteria group bacterium]